MAHHNRRKGIRIGAYRITPLGVGTLAVLLLAVIGIIVALAVLPRLEGAAPAPTPTPVPTVDAAATPSPSPTPSPTPEPRSATIRTLGEIAIENEVLLSALDRTTNTFDFAPMLSEVADIIGDADYTVADVEGTMGDVVSVSGAGNKMNTPSSILTALSGAGVDMITLANDHMLDGTAAELQATMQNVTNAGMRYIGASASQEERDTPVVVNINGINVGFLNYTDSLGGHESVLDDATRKYAVWAIANSNAAADIQKLRDAGAEVIVAYVSWGEMSSRTPSETQHDIAMVLVNQGVDVIIGYHPHVVQPAYWLTGETGHRTLCLCATGNLLSNQRAQYSDSGVIFEFTIQEQAGGGFAIESPRYIPTYVWRYDDAARGTYGYRTLAVGRWTEDRVSEQPEGMTYEDLQRMGAIWAEMQQVIDPEIATITRE